MASKTDQQIARMKSHVDNRSRFSLAYDDIGDEWERWDNSRNEVFAPADALAFASVCRRIGSSATSSEFLTLFFSKSIAEKVLPTTEETRHAGDLLDRFLSTYRAGDSNRLRPHESRDNEALVAWKAFRDVNLLFMQNATKPRHGDDLATSKDDSDSDWLGSSIEILDRLKSTSTPEVDRITAALFAETMVFSDQQKPELLGSLHAFAMQRRFSENTETLTAVGSAIRKFAMNMDASDLARYGDLFDYSDTEHLSCQVELELVKAAGWRLAELPRAEIKDSQKLEQRILEIVEAYLPPKLLLQKNYTAIVLNGLTALALLDSAKVDPLIDRVASLEASGKPVVWFRELLADRLREVAKQQDKCDPLRGVKLERWAQELDPATV